MIDKYAISFIGKVKRNVLVRLFRGSPPILVPDVHALTVFYKCRKAFAQSVHQLTDRDGKLLSHVGILRSLIVCAAPPVRLHVGEISPSASGDLLRSAPEYKRSTLFLNLDAKFPALYNDLFFCFFRRKISVLWRRKFKLWHALLKSHVVIRLDTEHFRIRRADLNRQVHPA